MDGTNTVPKDPEVKDATEEQGVVIDTSKMSAGQRAALELTEAARDAAAEQGSFGGGLFMGRFDLGAIHPFPVQKPEDRDQGDAFLQRLEIFPALAEARTEPLAVASTPNNNIRRWTKPTILILQR